MWYNPQTPNDNYELIIQNIWGGVLKNTIIQKFREGKLLKAVSCSPKLHVFFIKNTMTY